MQFIISTYAGSTSGSTGDNYPAINAQLSGVSGVVVDLSGNLYVADTYNNAIRFINKQTGIIKTIAGMVNGTWGAGGDGYAATLAKLSSPNGVSLDTMNNLYIADTGNNKIRLVTFSTGIITTFAGTGGESGSSGDGDAAISAQLGHPQAVGCDFGGNVYIADTGNNKIRKVNSDGIITTFAGVGGYSMGGMGSIGDGGKAIHATLSTPSGVAADNYGNVFIADSYNGRIRMVNSTGIIITIAGGGSCFGSCDGFHAVEVLFDTIAGVTLDISGNVYFTDSMFNRIYRVTSHGAGGTVMTVAGVGTYGSLGDGGPATSAYLSGPKAVAVDPVSGTVYIADSSNNRIRKVISVSKSQLSIPTGQPTGQPTKLPTELPTKLPTQLPMGQPTGQPTKLPTELPSIRPSRPSYSAHPTIPPSPIGCTGT